MNSWIRMGFLFLVVTHLVLVYALDEDVKIDPSDGDIGVPLTAANFERAKMPQHRQSGEKIDESKMYNISRFEGDIEEDDVGGRSRRNAVVEDGYRWPDAEVPYSVSSRFSEDDRDEIAAAIWELEDKTCVRFVKAGWDHKNYVFFKNAGGCASSLGMRGGVQYLRLGEGCNQRGTIMHELIHALGFYHEQSRTDRDEYIKVHYENMQPRVSGQFEKMIYGVTDFGTPYDYKSIMHYGTHAFSGNGQPTITPLKEGVYIGQRWYVSDNDALKIKLMYQCDKERTTKTTTTVVTEPPETTTRGPVNENCLDTIENCAELKEQGICSNPKKEKFVRNYCRGTCVKDRYTWCGEQFRKKGCKGKMLQTCPRTCDQC